LSNYSFPPIDIDMLKENNATNKNEGEVVLKSIAFSGGGDA